MKYIGAHVSASGGVFNAPLNASEIGATAFALFTKNQKQWAARPFSTEEIDRFRQNMKEKGFDPDYVLPHDSYLINLGNPFPEKREKSVSAFTDELVRAGQLGLKYVNFHPGSHLGEISEDECLDLVSDSMNRADEAAMEKGYEVIQVIEITAGQGSNIGYRFEHIKKLIDNFRDKKRVGVCIDTCHAYSAGYDLLSPGKFSSVIDEFDSIVGLEYLRAFHLNDSKKEFGSNVDRHAPLGQGTLGLEPFRFIMNQEIFDNMPLILETPDPELWAEEIKLLYSLQN